MFAQNLRVNFIHFIPIVHLRNVNRKLQNVIQIASRRLQNIFDVPQSKFRLQFNRTRFDFARYRTSRQLPRYIN